MRSKISILILGIMIFISMTIISSANAMEPPGTILIVEGGGDEVHAWIVYEGVEYQARELKYPLETQYWFENYGTYNVGDKVSIVISDGSIIHRFEVVQNKNYRNLYTYNIKNTSLENGKSLKRTLTLVSLRLVLTLIIEGIIFFVFGFRKMKSWIIFFGINLITQLGLNIYINTIEIARAYSIINVFIAEFWIFLVELIIIPLLVREHSTMRKLVYVLIANLLSLIVGGFILTVLPI